MNAIFRTNETVKLEWRRECERNTVVPDLCENCGEYVPEYLAVSAAVISGVAFLCELCSDALIEHDAENVP
jgi:hypothetical protein